MEDAYAIQAALVRRFVDAGRVIRGWKIGLTSKAMQYALNIDIPDSGVLFEDMFFDNGGAVPTERFIATRIEAEICFIMKDDLQGPGVTAADVIAATESVCPSLEILDTRIIPKDPKPAPSARLPTPSAIMRPMPGSLGNARHAIDAFDLRWVGAIVSRDGEVEETGLGAGVLNDPVEGIWLANRLAQYGDKISAGDVVLSGSFIRPVQAPGIADRGRFGDFGQVSCRFV